MRGVLVAAACGARHRAVGSDGCRRGRGVTDVAAFAPPALEPFNRAGVLNLADVHVAKALARVCAVDDPDVVLAAALAVRAPRLGHVYVELASVAETVAPDEDSEVDVDSLPWPDAAAWLRSLEQSDLVGD